MLANFKVDKINKFDEAMRIDRSMLLQWIGFFGKKKPIHGKIIDSPFVIKKRNFEFLI